MSLYLRDIFFQQVALVKVFNFATTNIFETRVAGRMVADMCRAASKVSFIHSDSQPMLRVNILELVS